MLLCFVLCEGLIGASCCSKRATSSGESSNNWIFLRIDYHLVPVNYKLKQMALSGELQRSNMRAICWKVV